MLTVPRPKSTAYINIQISDNTIGCSRYEPGAVALLVVNIEKNSVQLKLGSLGGSQVDLYLLTPTSGSIDSRLVVHIGISLTFSMLFL